MPNHIIEQYAGRVPSEIIEMWSQYGYGTAVDGFIKIIDPDEYRERLAESLPRPDLIPVFATGLADIIAWDGQYYVDFKYRYGTVAGLGSELPYFHLFLDDEEFLREDLEWSAFPKAVAELGPLAADECFGYVPLLALGGPEKVSHLSKVKLIEHVNLITQLAGPIQY